MGVKLGMEGKLYRNKGTYETPDWEELANVKDLTLNLEKGEADVTTRANGGWKATLGTLKDASVEFEMVWDTADEGFTAIQQAYFAGTPIELAIMDGDIETAGSQGLRATFSVTSFSRKEPLEEAMSVSVTVKPAYAEHAPEWMTVAGS
jgi:TP901-1 family phage major tail protein